MTFFHKWLHEWTQMSESDLSKHLKMAHQNQNPNWIVHEDYQRQTEQNHTQRFIRKRHIRMFFFEILTKNSEEILTLVASLINHNSSTHWVYAYQHTRWFYPRGNAQSETTVITPLQPWDAFTNYFGLNIVWMYVKKIAISILKERVIDTGILLYRVKLLNTMHTFIVHE